MPLIRKIPGFEAWFVLRVENDKVISVSLFHTKEGAEESVRKAEGWVAHHIVSFLKWAPKIAVDRAIIYQWLSEPKSPGQAARERGERVPSLTS